MFIVIELVRFLLFLKYVIVHIIIVITTIAPKKIATASPTLVIGSLSPFGNDGGGGGFGKYVYDGKAVEGDGGLTTTLVVLDKLVKIVSFDTLAIYERRVFVCFNFLLLSIQ